MNIDRTRVAIAGGVVLVILLLVLAPTLLYVVDARELAVVLEFGKPVVDQTEPGLYFKVPFIQEVRKLPSTKQFWGDHPSDALPDLPTKDDKKIEVLPWAIWRVKEPTVFVQRLRTLENAEQRVGQFVRGAIRDVITQYDLAELVRSTDRELVTSADQATMVGEAATTSPNKPTKVRIQFGRQQILDEIKEQARRRLASGSAEEAGGRGIELIDVGISQIEFVESVRRKTFDRWIAERTAISALNTNEGERMKQEILNRTNAEVQRIEGEGTKEANEIRGRVDAEIIRDYAKAIEETGDFFVFIRTLEAYKKALGRDTRLIITTDSDFFGMLKKLDDVPQATPETAK